MISSFHIGNFKSYREAVLPLAPLTLLIGANASGKSNAIEAIRLLAILSDGRRLADVLSEIQSSDIVVRGNAEDLPADSAKPVVLGCDLENTKWCCLEVGIQMTPDCHISDERVTADDGEVLYRLHTIGHRGDPFQFVDIVPDEIQIPVTDQQAVFTQLGSPARLLLASNAAAILPTAVAEFRENLGRIIFFDPQPRQMRGYSYAGDSVLKEDGSNLSAVLYNITSANGFARRQILNFVSEIPEQPFVDLDFIVTDRRDVMVRLTESYGNRTETRDAPVLSDGTLRVLGIAAALFSARPGSTVVIEEIDNGVHPSRAEALLRNIEQVAKERELRVLLTTHNPALLDRLSTEAIPHVVCAYRDPEDGDSRLVRLDDLPSYPELVARGPLGQLMTRGVLDYFLKHQESAEEKQVRSQNWLEALKAQVAET